MSLLDHLLRQAGQRTVHALVKTPGFDDGQPQRVLHFLHHQPGRLDRTRQPAGVHDIELDAVLLQQAARVRCFLLAFKSQWRVLR